MQQQGCWGKPPTCMMDSFRYAAVLQMTFEVHLENMELKGRP
jgi:hypothetical protein